MGLSIWHVLVMLVVLILVFGTSRIKTLGRDLGTALKDFRQTVNENPITGSEKLSEKSDVDISQQKP